MIQAWRNNTFVRLQASPLTSPSPHVDYRLLQGVIRCCQTQQTRNYKLTTTTARLSCLCFVPQNCFHHCSLAQEERTATNEASRKFATESEMANHAVIEGSRWTCFRLHHPQQRYEFTARLMDNDFRPPLIFHHHRWPHIVRVRHCCCVYPHEAEGS